MHSKEQDGNSEGIGREIERVSMKVVFVRGPQDLPEDQEIDKIVEVKTRWTKALGVYEWGCLAAREVYGDVHVEAVSFPIHDIYKQVHCDALQNAKVLVRITDTKPSPWKEALSEIIGEDV
jgi:hypothetical protein